MNARFPASARDTSTRTTSDITLRLRLLGTTDLHAHLMPYDYYAEEDGRPYGLLRTATLIREARLEATNTMLFDNGDSLQGTPLGDITRHTASGWRGPNPVIAAMNCLGYDAAGLGNHEFNFGVDWLNRALADASFPFTCANIFTHPCPAGVCSYLPPFLLLRRQFYDMSGDLHDLSLGIIGLVPPQITTWDEGYLFGRIEARDMVEVARDMIPKVRAAGADLVLLLAHTGIEADPAGPMAENAALALAALPGVDAIMTGHSHDLFPHPLRSDAVSTQAGSVDHARGTLNGTPALQAGAFGAHLGVMDLTLKRLNERWAVTGHHCELRAVGTRGAVPRIPPDPNLSRTVRAAHIVTRRHMRKPVGQCAQRLHSYLALVRPDPSVAAVNQLQKRILARAVEGTVHEGLPILSATAAFKTGGRGGPRNFTDVPAGPISLRHAADLYTFPNHLCGLLITGAQLRDWLERAAICFATQMPDMPEAALRDPAIPGHDFDVIAGLTYQIDLSALPRFDRHSNVINAEAWRIRNLCHDGHPLRDSDRFLLATTTYRTSGGAFMRAERDAIVHISAPLLRDEMVAQITRTPLSAPTGHAAHWRFAPMAGNTILLDTGPRLRTDRASIHAAGAEDLGITPEGFLKLRIPL